MSGKLLQLVSILIGPREVSPVKGVKEPVRPMNWDDEENSYTYLLKTSLTVKPTLIDLFLFVSSLIPVTVCWSLYKLTAVRYSPSKKLKLPHLFVGRRSPNYASSTIYVTLVLLGTPMTA